MGVAELARGREHVLRADEAAVHSGDVCAAIIRAFHEIARFDWCAVMSTDPETYLPSGGVVEGFPREACGPFWDNELLDPDFLKFTDLARSFDPVETLFDAVDGDMERSPRYQKLYAGLGAADELRVAFVAGSSCVAVGAFLRAGPDGPFTAQELTDVRALLPTAVVALRRALGRLCHDDTSQPPAVIILDAAGDVTSMTVGAQEVLDDLRINDVDDGFPGIVRVAATKARWSRTSTTLATRLRGRSGRCVRLQVSPMDDDAGAVAVTVETARPQDLGRILLDSYGLTDRETDVVLHLCRGLSTKEVAAELLISAHTVRDHIKSIFDKAGVNSRGELVATLFSNHVLEHFHDGVAHIDSAR